MKSILQFACCGLLLMLGCRNEAEKNDTASAQTGASKLNASVGQEIPLETAQRWIASYNKEKTSGRVGGLYRLTASTMNLMLQAMPNRTGVTLHNATDDIGTHHILVTAVEVSAGLWTSPVVVDANINIVIEKKTAMAWAKKYISTHPKETQYNFFGDYLFRQITANPDFNYMDMVPALNDVGAPQLLLLVWNNANGRVAKHPVVYDLSSPCPGYCI